MNFIYYFIYRTNIYELNLNFEITKHIHILLNYYIIFMLKQDISIYIMHNTLYNIHT